MKWVWKHHYFDPVKKAVHPCVDRDWVNTEMQFGNFFWSSLTLKGKREGDINPQIPHISRLRISHQWQEIPLKSASLYTPSPPLKDITANRQSKSTCFLYVQHMLFWRHLGGLWPSLSCRGMQQRKKKISWRWVKDILGLGSTSTFNRI